MTEEMLDYAGAFFAAALIGALAWTALVMF